MKVELSLHASKLPNVAGLFKGTSDPFAVVTLVAAENGAESQVLGKTEVIKNTLNPRWAKTFIFDYELGRPMHVAISIYDEIRKGQNKSMGSAMFEIGSLLGKKGGTQAKKMKGGGTVFAHVEKNVGSGTLRLQLRGMKLKNVEGFMKKSDPFYEIRRKTDGPAGDSWETVYRSQPVMDNLSPVWSDAVIDLSTLCGGDLDRPIKVFVYDYEKSGKHVPMGDFETTVNGLVASKNSGGDINRSDVQSAFQLTKMRRPTGQIFVLKADVSVADDGLSQNFASAVSVSDTAHNTYAAPMPVVLPPPPPPSHHVALPSAPPAEPATSAAYVPPAAGAFVPNASKPTFVDYIRGGCELHMCVAIDFTGSNGDPRVPGTLHHISRDGSLNDYEKAICAIGEILAKYDSDQKFPVWGFGAKYGGVVRHCFQCGPKIEVDGVDGILRAYRSVFQSGLIMSGPTVFTEVIQTAATHAQNAQDAASRKGEQAYTILLILTDGSVSDVNATAACLSQVSDAPLSIVIVGIGRADFGAMQFLDDFKGKRDIAQFVEFNKHRGNQMSFTSATLDEVPDQLVGYFTGKGIRPLRPLRKSDDEIMVEPYKPEEDIDLSLNFSGADNEIIVAGSGAYIPPKYGF